MKTDIKILEHSVRQRLLDISKNRRIDYQFCLTHYCLERFLYRLSHSIHADKFILKGALLLMAWTDEKFRPTRDLDLLGYGNATPDNLNLVITDTCRTEVQPDGLVFDTDAITIEEIRESLDYDGYRVKTRAYLGNVRIPIQIDVAFGDVISPEPEILSYPTLLDLPPASVKTYPKETVVAEKLQAAIVLGIRNSRMKDFFDLYWLSQLFSFRSIPLADAIQATFNRRKTELPATTPLPLTQDFASDAANQSKWRAFLNKSDIGYVPSDFRQIISKLENFLMIPIRHTTENDAAELAWGTGGPWN